LIYLNKGSILVSDLLTRAVALHRGGKLAEAEGQYRELLRAQPDHFDAQHLLGILKHQQQRNAEALQLIGGALRGNPDAAEALSNYGVVLAALKRHQEALASYDRAIAVSPGYAEAFNNRGNALQDLERYEEALASYDKAIAIKPDYAEALNNRGNALRALDRHEDALASYDRGLAIKPRDVEALNGRGVALQALERHEEALASYEQALAINPRHAEANYNRGNALRDLNRLADALASYDRAIAINPDHAAAFNNRGHALQQLGRRQEALASYDRATAIKPDYARALVNRGNLLLELARPAEALSSCNRALAIEPDNTEALSMRGNALCDLHRHEEALASYIRAAAIKPDLAGSHYNESWLRLLRGEFPIGWEKYEWRWKVESFASPPRDFSQPLWLGKESLRGKTILLHAEQGLGDTIQFVRYAELVADQGAEVLLEVQPELKCLLSGLSDIASVLGRGESLPSFDVHSPLLSLPLAFGTDLQTIPAKMPYLHAPTDRIEHWKARLPGADVLRVGFCCSGNPSHKNDRNRSIAPALLAPLLSIPNIEFFCMQKNLRPAEAEFLARHPQIHNLGPELGSFVETAAVIANLDVVVSVDTALAHLAGAMARPVWILLPFSPDWRWMLNRSDSPWYPTATLFRQARVGMWQDVLACVGGQLDRLGAEKQSLGSFQSSHRGSDSFTPAQLPVVCGSLE
jgi:tetratricopeptide (TPR) repeat protein